MAHTDRHTSTFSEPLGTVLTVDKEIIRIVAVERTARGTSQLWRGLRDGRRIARDRSFALMPTLAGPRTG